VSGESAGETGTVDAAMLWGAGMTCSMNSTAIVGARWFDDDYDYSQKKAIMVLLRRERYIMSPAIVRGREFRTG
jgi:hypothetical protein